MQQEKEKGCFDHKRECILWKKRTLLERYLLLICLVLFIVFLTMIGLVIYLEHSHRRPPICESAVCYREAGEIISGMNFSANPCEDFHNFACGSFVKYALPQDSDVNTYTTINGYMLQGIKESLEEETDGDEPDFVRRVKLFYKSCLNHPTDTSEVIRQLLDITKLNAWPLRIMQQQVDDIPKLEESLARVVIFNTMNPFFGMVPKNGSLSLFGRPPSMISKEILLNETDEDCIRKKETYKRLMAYVFSKIGLSLDDMKLEIDELIKFKTSLAEIVADNTKDPQNTTFTEMESICPQFKWTKFWKLVNNLCGKSNDYNENIPVRVYRMSYIKNLCRFLERSDPRIIHDYLVWEILPFYVFHDNYHQLFPEIIVKEPDAMPNISVRWKWCIHYMTKRRMTAMKPGVNYLMIKRMGNKELIQEAITYTEKLKQAMRDMFSSENWLDQFSKEKAMKKLESIQQEIGYSNVSVDLDVLQRYFNHIAVTDNFLQNYISDIIPNTCNAILDVSSEFPQLMQKFRNSMDIWPDAFYQKDDDHIGITLSLLTSPYLVLGVSRYLNYGGIGAVLGHEFTHAFDSLDLDNFKEHDTDRWPNKTIELFKEKEKCYIDQYSQFPIDDSGIMVNGDTTKTNDIADNSGISQALTAYEEYLAQHGEEPRLPGLDFTNQQMFFIRRSQTYCERMDTEIFVNATHSPGKYRIIVPLQNSQRFSEAFNCAVGSPMNPRNKCTMWGK